MQSNAEMTVTPASRPRLTRIDIARGVALIAMAIYHFGWDLEFFGYMAPATTAHGGWKLFARCIASSFLFLVGFSLVLALGSNGKASVADRSGSSSHFRCDILYVTR
jgi:uncharacterized membrane protein